MISKFLFNFINFCLIVIFFLTRLRPSRVLFSTAVKAVVVAKLLTLGISNSTSFISALIIFLVARFLISGILPSLFFILALYSVFLTTLLSLLKSTGVVSNSEISSLSPLLFKLLKLVGTYFSLSISNLSPLAFKLTISHFAANLNVSVFVAFFKSDFVT